MRLGEILLAGGAVTEEELERALARARQVGQRLGGALIALGIVDADQVASALGEQKGVAAARDRLLRQVAAATVALVPAELARRLCVVPLRLEGDGGELSVAMRDPDDEAAIAELERATGHAIRPAVASEVRLRQAIEGIYAAQTRSREQAPRSPTPVPGVPIRASEPRRATPVAGVPTLASAAATPPPAARPGPAPLTMPPPIASAPAPAATAPAGPPSIDVSAIGTAETLGFPPPVRPPAAVVAASLDLLDRVPLPALDLAPPGLDLGVAASGTPPPAALEVVGPPVEAPAMTAALVLDVDAMSADGLTLPAEPAGPSPVGELAPAPPPSHAGGLELALDPTRANGTPAAGHRPLRPAITPAPGRAAEGEGVTLAARESPFMVLAFVGVVAAVAVVGIWLLRTAFGPGPPASGFQRSSTLAATLTLPAGSWKRMVEPIAPMGFLPGVHVRAEGFYQGASEQLPDVGFVIARMGIPGSFPDEIDMEVLRAQMHKLAVDMIGYQSQGVRIDDASCDVSYVRSEPAGECTGTASGHDHAYGLRVYLWFATAQDLVLLLYVARDGVERAPDEAADVVKGFEVL